MANVTSAQNNNSRDLDPLVLVSSGAAKLKRAVAGTNKTASGITPDTHAEEVGTHANGTAWAATDAMVLAAAVADDTSPASVSEGQVGYLRMTLAHLLKTVSTADAAVVTSVNSTNASTTLLAANANRIGATFYNTDANALYLKFGATASTSSFTVKLNTDDYYELPNPVYRGVIDGIWAADGAGVCVITELT